MLSIDGMYEQLNVFQENNCHFIFEQIYWFSHRIRKYIEIVTNLLVAVCYNPFTHKVLKRKHHDKPSKYDIALKSVMWRLTWLVYWNDQRRHKCVDIFAILPAFILFPPLLWANLNDVLYCALHKFNVFRCCFFLRTVSTNSTVGAQFTKETKYIEFIWNTIEHTIWICTPS